jgi:NitT/TauT family transport system substrate-binding protein
MINLLRYTISILIISSLTGAFPANAQLTKIKFGDLGASTENLYQYLAVEKGIYGKYGIDLDLVEFLQGGPELTAAAASGQIDMGSVGTPVLVAISRGLPIRVVGSPPRKGQPFILVGRPEAKEISDLRGKMLGISSVGGGSSQALKRILKAHGIGESDITTIAFGTGPNGYLSLKSGKLAAAVLAEPFATKAELDGVGHILAEAETYFDHYQHSYIFASRKFIKDHPEAITAYFRATSEALDYAKTHQDELVAFGHKRLALDETLLKAVFAKQIPKWNASGAIDNEGLFNAVRIVQELGDINKTYRPDIDQIIDTRFIDERRAN